MGVSTDTLVNNVEEWITEVKSFIVHDPVGCNAIAHNKAISDKSKQSLSERTDSLNA